MEHRENSQVWHAQHFMSCMITVDEGKVCVAFSPLSFGILDGANIFKSIFI